MTKVTSLVSTPKISVVAVIRWSRDAWQHSAPMILQVLFTYAIRMLHIEQVVALWFRKASVIFEKGLTYSGLAPFFVQQLFILTVINIFCFNILTPILY